MEPLGTGIALILDSSISGSEDCSGLHAGIKGSLDRSIATGETGDCMGSRHTQPSVVVMVAS